MKAIAQSLTPSSLSVALQKIATAKTQEECAVSLVSAASLIQDAIMNNQDNDSFHAALDACPTTLSEELGLVLDRVATFNQLPDGSGTLGLWMVPVCIDSTAELPATLPLNPLKLMAVAGAVQAQFGVTSDTMRADKPMPWVIGIPKLYSEAQIRNSDIGELVRLPLQARAFAQGDIPAIRFMEDAEDTGATTGVRIYFAPLVVFHPDGVIQPESSDKMVYRLTRCVEESVQPHVGDAAVSINMSDTPFPFYLALEKAQQLQFSTALYKTMDTIVEKSKVEPNGMVALVAPYYLKKSNRLCLGISLMSRLSKDKLALINLPISSYDGFEEAVMASDILKQMGMENVKRHDGEPIPTFACQNCNHVQLAMPPSAMLNHGVMDETMAFQ